MTAGADITTDLEFSLWKGNSKIYGEYVTTSKTVSYEYTPSITATYRINFRLRDYGYDGADQTFYLDNVIIRNTALALIEENNYYPFGLKHQGYNATVSSNTNAVATKFKYNGKELQDDLIGGNSLGLYDYGARMYDPALGRWHVIDPLAEKYYNWSPYNYAVNSPIRFLDPDGKSVNKNDEFNARDSRIDEFFNGVSVSSVTVIGKGGGSLSSSGSVVVKDKNGTPKVVETGEGEKVGEKETKNKEATSGGTSNKNGETGGGNQGGFPDKLYSYDANKGDVYVSSKDVINIFGQSCQPVTGTVTVWGGAIYDWLAGSSSVIPEGVTVPVMMVQITLQLEDWTRNSILMDYNNNGGGQGMIMNYRESIQDMNGYLHVARSITLIDAVNGRNYGTYNQNYLPQK